MNLKTLLLHYMSYPYRVVKDRLVAAKGSIDEIQPGSGQIIDLNGKKTAVYKDRQGKVTMLSPSCTHLGCIVEWDGKNKQWLCPCHLSKFKASGEVIKGPAKKDLKRI